MKNVLDCLYKDSKFTLRARTKARLSGLEVSNTKVENKPGEPISDKVFCAKMKMKLSALLRSLNAWEFTYIGCVEIEVIGRHRIHRVTYWEEQCVVYRLIRVCVAGRGVSHQGKNSFYWPSCRKHHMVPIWEVNFWKKVFFDTQK